MKYCVVNRGDNVSLQLTEKFHKLAASYAMEIDEADPDLIVSIGGDGTTLHAFHLYQHCLNHVIFVGIHTGHLGFFADWMPEELEQLLLLINKSSENNSARIVQFPLVCVELEIESGSVERHLALNEFTMKAIEGSLVARLNINDEMFEMFRGDGICISTPCGSTAYNKSLGGAVIHPSLEAIQIAEISSINNRVYRTLGSSMILPKHHHCQIIPQNQSGQIASSFPNGNDQPQFVLSLDHLSMRRSDIRSIRLQVAQEKISFVRYRPFPFWTRVREAFLGYEERGNL